MEKASQYTTKFLTVSVPYTLTLIKPPAGHEGRLHERGVLAELRRLDEIPEADHRQAGRAELTTDAYLPRLLSRTCPAGTEPAVR